jgi:hypothetical protein
MADRGLQRSPAVTTGAKEPQVRPPTQRPPGSLPGGGPEFESPDPAAASPLGSCHETVVHRRRATPSTQAGNRYLQVQALSFSPAVPPTCHKQRARAVSSGQSRSLRDGRCAACGPLTRTVDMARHCMACKGSLEITALAAIPFARSEPSNQCLRWPARPRRD